MAVDMFLKVDDVKGESVDGKHAGEIEVLSWSWGMTQSGTTHSGTGGGAGKVDVHDISLTKYVDSASPNFIKACCSGLHYQKALLTVRKAGGPTAVEYLKITMEDLLISGISSGGSGGGDRLTETVTLNFGRFKTEYAPQDAKGAAGAVIEATWDIAKNQP
jgi:type VI secretion system secreted protein Hcp